ncbi:SMP-30/gluconolactonase/LRE family protein [Streptomyces albidoflavus]
MRRTTLRSLAGIAALTTLALTGCGTQQGLADDSPAAAGPAERTITAKRLAHLTQPHEQTGMTLLEGPLLDAEGRLLVVDVTAPAGEPKVIRVDVKKGKGTPFHTDDRGAYTSAQYSPHDGRIYLTDYAHGEIVSLAPGGGDRQVFFTGKVDGAAMHPDDLAFDQRGNLYVSDSRGLSEGTAEGRVVRISRDGKQATVLADKLAATNGISFDAEYRGLWFSELTENRISYLRLDDQGEVTSRHTAIRVDGGLAQTDSIAVDADGNLYQGLHGRPAMAVYDRHGERLATIEIPARHQGLESATNVAITPGGTRAYLTVSGPAGGYVYTFDALAEGIRQSNGG